LTIYIFKTWHNHPRPLTTIEVGRKNQTLPKIHRHPTTGNSTP
jgi:hypothetical protein